VFNNLFPTHVPVLMNKYGKNESKLIPIRNQNVEEVVQYTYKMNPWLRRNKFRSDLVKLLFYQEVSSYLTISQQFASKCLREDIKS